MRGVHWKLWKKRKYVGNSQNKTKKTGMGALAGAGNGGCAECTGKSEYTFFTTELALETFCSPD
jgi:hypothetical protein